MVSHGLWSHVPSLASDPTSLGGRGSPVYGPRSFLGGGGVPQSGPNIGMSLLPPFPGQDQDRGTPSPPERITSLFLFEWSVIVIGDVRE